jgi:diketogulonate reductase-like aldo/keto reductase
MALCWLVEQDGVAAITRTSNAAHCRDGLDIFDFELDAGDKDAISALDDGTRMVDPGWAPTWDD